MSKYRNQAAKEVDSAIKAAKKTNAGARKQTKREYAQYLAKLDASRDESRASMDSTQDTERQRMANRLAARGLDGAGASDFNYGRLNAEHEGQISGLLKNYQTQRGDLLTGQGKAIDAIDAQDRALEAEAEAKIGQLARELEDRAWNRRMQEQQLAMQRAAARRAAQEASDALKPMKEQPFIDNLLQNYYKGADAPSLAAFARSQGRSLTNYYDILPRSFQNAVNTRYMARKGTENRRAYPQLGYTPAHSSGTLQAPRSSRYSTMTNVGGKYYPTYGSDRDYTDNWFTRLFSN